MSQRKISRLLGVTLRAARNGALNREFFLTDAATCVLIPRKTRKDCVQDQQMAAVHNFCHDVEYTRYDTFNRRPLLCREPGGEFCKHGRRNWEGRNKNDDNHYNDFLKSVHYKAYFDNIKNDETRGDAFAEKDPPFEKSTFEKYICRCVCDPTEVSCIDTILDDFECHFAALASHFQQQKEENWRCECAWCKSPGNENKKCLLEIFRKPSNRGGLSTLREACLCPAVEEPHISIEGQEKRKFYKYLCIMGRCNSCGVDRKVRTKCEVLLKNNSQVSFQRWESVTIKTKKKTKNKKNCETLPYQ